MKDYTERGAKLSDCGQYRYRLWRGWNTGQGTLVYVLYNPSTADAAKSDKTLDQCVVFAQREGFQRLEIVNLFALRSTKPSAVAVDWNKSVGPENDAHITAALQRANKVVAAWGDIETMGRDQAILKVLRAHHDVWCLGLTKEGAPRHPSRLAHDTPLRLFYRKSS